MDKVFGRFQRYFSGGSGSNGMVTSSSSSNDDRDGSDIEEDFDDFSTERSRFGFGLLDRSYTPISTKDSRNQHGLDHKPGFFSKSSNRDHQKYYPTDSDSGNTSSSYHTQSPSEGGGLGGSFQGFSNNDGRQGSEDWASDWQDDSWKDDEASKSRKPGSSSSVKKANPDPLIDFGSDQGAKKASKSSSKKSNDNWGDNWGDDDAWESLNEK